MNKQQPWTIGRVIFACLMSLLLLGYFAVMATYSDPTTTGRAFQFPGYVWILRVITGVMAIYLGKLWKDKGFRILAVFLLLKLIRVIAENGDNVFSEAVSDIMLTGIWVFAACYGMARVFNREQLKRFLNINVAIWTLGMTVSSCMGIYAAWTGKYIYTIGEGAVWGLPWRSRLFLVYFPTVSGSVASLSAVLALCGAIISKRKPGKILFLLSMFPMIVALSLTDSRCAQVTVSAGIAMTAGIFILRALRRRAIEKGKKTWSAWVISITSAGIMLVILVFICMKTITVFNKVRADGLLIPRAFADEVKRKVVSNRGYGGDNVLTSRPQIWRAAIEVLKNNPLFLLWGASVRSPMTLVNASKIMTFTASHCHCMPLMILLENGIPGLVLAGAFMFRAATAAFRLVLKAENKRDVLLVPFVVSILLGELIECFTWLRAGQSPTLPFFFIAMGIIVVAGQKQNQESMIDMQEIPA